MTEQVPLETRPPSAEVAAILAEFNKEVINQVRRLDDLARELFKLELGVPGIFAVAVKVTGDQPVATPSLIFVALGLWLCALVLTLAGLFPKPYRVLQGVVDRQPGDPIGKGLTIREFYSKCAQYKRRQLVGGTFCFFLGILSATLAVI